jgi:hypothetical protein
MAFQLRRISNSHSPRKKLEINKRRNKLLNLENNDDLFNNIQIKISIW